MQATYYIYIFDNDTQKPDVANGYEAIIYKATNAIDALRQFYKQIINAKYWHTNRMVTTTVFEAVPCIEL